MVVSAVLTFSRDEQCYSFFFVLSDVPIVCDKRIHESICISITVPSLVNRLPTYGGGL